MNKLLAIIMLLTGFGAMAPTQANPDKHRLLLLLNGSWRFSIGDQADWAEPSYDDSNWEQIRVPASWESQGFHGYDGYAWYRKVFYATANYDNKTIKLQLGYIDDVDEVFLNGVKIGGMGSFPPNYSSAYNVARRYTIPAGLLNIGGRNVIAVRIYDRGHDGGILNGKICLLEEEEAVEPIVNLQGVWQFRIGDNLMWKDAAYDDNTWQDIQVPGYWDNQGFAYYDGYAWYKKQFYLKSELQNKKPVLVLGPIDDMDQVYLNGELVGFTGKLDYQSGYHGTIGEHLDFRGYYLPAGVLKNNAYNTIAIRVYDEKGRGGIYEGPIGILPQEEYIKYWRKRKGYNVDGFNKD